MNSTDSIRTDGRETLARTLPQNGARTGGEGTVASDVAGGRREDEGRNARTDATVQEAGNDAAAGPRPRLGNGAGGIHPAARRRPSRRPPGRKANRRISTVIASPTTTGWAKAVPNKSSSKTSGPSKSCGSSRPRNARPRRTKRPRWSNMSAGARCPRSSTSTTPTGARNKSSFPKFCPTEEHRSARATTLNAHYTSPDVIRAMYQAAQRFGFQGGNILEPACGIGHFIGLMPEEMLRQSTVTGIEIDPLTARIAERALSRRRHPRAAV